VKVIEDGILCTDWLFFTLYVRVTKRIRRTKISSIHTLFKVK